MSQPNEGEMRIASIAFETDQIITGDGKVRHKVFVAGESREAVDQMGDHIAEVTGSEFIAKSPTHELNDSEREMVQGVLENLGNPNTVPDQGDSGRTTFGFNRWSDQAWQPPERKKNWGYNPAQPPQNPNLN